MDLIGAGFTNHGSNQGGILIDTESGGHVEFINADPRSRVDGAGARRASSRVEELYNTNRNPVEHGHRAPAACTRTRTRSSTRSATAPAR